MEGYGHLTLPTLPGCRAILPIRGIPGSNPGPVSNQSEGSLSVKYVLIKKTLVPLHLASLTVCTYSGPEVEQNDIITV